MAIGSGTGFHWRAAAAWPRVRAALIALAMLAGLPFVLGAVFAVINPPASALMLWRAIGGAGIDYRWRDMDQIAPVLVVSVITREDSRFCSHHGVDWQEVGQVLESSESGDKPRGASTISMQVAKNLFLWPQRSYLRKALEVPLALWIDLLWSKRRVIEVYLNIAEWGPGVYGAEAAAQYHFRTSATRLNARRAALLAAALPDPHRRRAGRPGPLTRRLAVRAERQARHAAADISCL